MEKAVSEPAGATPEAPVTSPGREEREQGMTGVCVVLDDFVCTLQTP